jgi:hypothetical protein
LSDAPASCHVCGELLGAEAAICHRCERAFHLRSREDSGASDCGEVWINEQFLTMEFACNVCLGKTASPEPPVARGH